MTVFQISCDNVKQHCWGFYVALDKVNVSYVIGHMVRIAHMVGVIFA